MAKSRDKKTYPHEDADLFKECIMYTAGELGLNAQLVEKDYYASLILDYLYEDKKTELVFKGGTCLSKVYTEFYRLSEDLDFTISASPGTTRVERREKIKPVKNRVAFMPEKVSGLTVAKEFTGHHKSTQYIAHAEYKSAIRDGGEKQNIKIEIGMREELIEKARRVKAGTLLANPFTKKPEYEPISLFALSFIETYAEKFRAALTRKEPAIRDYYDIFYAVKREKLNITDKKLQNFVRKKLEVPGNEEIDISADRKMELEKQLEGQLKPVLRKRDFDEFDIDYAYELVMEMGEKTKSGR
jgi:predicted nucleotidyltransferase component of viral defense system